MASYSAVAYLLCTSGLGDPELEQEFATQVRLARPRLHGAPAFAASYTPPARGLRAGARVPATRAAPQALPPPHSTAALGHAAAHGRGALAAGHARPVTANMPASSAARSTAAPQAQHMLQAARTPARPPNMPRGPQVSKEAYQWPMVAFGTAFFLNFLTALFERDGVKFQLALVACYINLLAGFGCVRACVLARARACARRPVALRPSPPEPTARTAACVQPLLACAYPPPKNCAIASGGAGIS